MKKILVLFLLSVLVLTGLFTPAISAQNSESLSFQQQTIDPMAFQYIFQARSYIEYDGAGIVYIEGRTTTMRRVDEVRTSIILQRWDGNNWVNLQTYTRPQYNAFESFLSGTVSVPRGYYYRIRAIHAVNNNGFIETTNTTTLPIYAN